MSTVLSLRESRTSSQSHHGAILCKGPEATCLLPCNGASGAWERGCRGRGPAGGSGKCWADFLKREIYPPQWLWMPAWRRVWNQHPFGALRPWPCLSQAEGGWRSASPRPQPRPAAGRARLRRRRLGLR